MITTARLKIRPIERGDAESLMEIGEDFRASEYFIYDIPLPSSGNDIERLLDRLIPEGLFFAVLLHERMIGYISFFLCGEGYDMGFCFLRQFHGKGYAFESCMAAMEHIAATRGVRKFSAGAALGNLPSVRLLYRLGFELEGCERLAFHKNSKGEDIFFESGIFTKRLR